MSLLTVAILKRCFYINEFFIFNILFQELKAGIVSGQLLLDFLCQSGPQVMGADVQALRSERSTFSETLGALRLRWLHLRRELESQVSISATNTQYNTTTFSELI